jgi:phage terminase large subunit-like protein
MSFAVRTLERLVRAHGKTRTREIVLETLASLSVVELAAQEHDWPGVWARAKQIPPARAWQSFGFLTGRGYGKTLAISKHVNGEVQAGRAMLIGLAAQDEDNSVKLQVTGPSGLIATAPPWFRPEWHASELTLVWPNGAKAFVRTPEVPGKIRGFDYHLSWITELQSWPGATRDEAYMNFLLATRLGYARIVWDATAKRRHPLLRKLLAQGEADPKRHVVVRGATRENEANLGTGYLEKLEAEMGGTQRGREELGGEMLEDSEGALVKAPWIERNRRAAPDRVLRRVLAIDPAVTSRSGSDMTGIVDVALALDEKVLVMGDYTGKHAPEAWAATVLDKYFSGRCDLVIVETNKGGDLLTRNLRAAAGERGVTVVVIGKEERAPGHIAGTLHVREVYGRGEKADRAQPLATAYERDRVCHVRGAVLEELETTLCTWEPAPGAKSPDRLDPLVYAVVELLGLASNAPDPSVGFRGIAALAAAVEAPRRPSNMSRLLGGGGSGGGRI